MKWMKKIMKLIIIMKMKKMRIIQEMMKIPKREIKQLMTF